MAKKKVGRPSKIDNDTMREVNVWFVFIIVILFVLLSMTIITIVNPNVIENIKASIINLFK